MSAKLSNNTTEEIDLSQKTTEVTSTHVLGQNAELAASAKSSTIKEATKLQKKYILILMSVSFVIIGFACVAFTLQSNKVKNASSTNSLGLELIEKNVRIEKCVQVTGNTKPSDFSCFDLKGNVYKVNNSDTERIVTAIQRDIVRYEMGGRKNDVKQYTGSSAKAIVDKLDNLDEASGGQYSGHNTHRMVSVYFSGGVWGDYDFPYSEDGKAIYIAASAPIADEQEEDSVAAFQSMFGVTETQAKTMYEKERTFNKTQYTLLIAKNY